jgi:hypothetical protein
VSGMDKELPPGSLARIARVALGQRILAHEPAITGPPAPLPAQRSNNRRESPQDADA